MPISTPDDPAAVRRDPADAGSPAAPSMPSFASLRDPRRRGAIDLLVPPAPPAAAEPAAPPRPPAAPRPPAPRPPAAPRAAAAGAQRPPEWADLWRLGVHVTVALAGVPVRVVRWQGRCLRTLLGV